jgi:hypothetical protein
MSNDAHLVSVDQEINTISIDCPLMADFSEIVPVASVLDQIEDLPHDNNFEVVYSALSKLPQHKKVCLELESAIYTYFNDLKLPDHPTIYDHLILSLREKDVIATFNWDPFLIQAYSRTPKAFNKRKPKLLFLHGNVLSAYCEKDKVLGVKGRNCSKCGNLLTHSKLLFPVAKKDYSSNPAITGDWKSLKEALRFAFMVTIFGYSAPTSDADAKAILQEAWGPCETRSLEQFEFVDIKSADELTELWKGFIHTHHFDVKNDFYDSWIANHPRRTGEAWWNQDLEAKFISNNPIPRTADFPELYGWFERLIKVEA